MTCHSRPVGVAALVATAIVLACTSTAVSAAGQPRRPFHYCAKPASVTGGAKPFLEISDESIEASTGRFRNCSFAAMAAAHIGEFRGGLNWADTEYAPFRYSFAYYDDLIADLARHHLRFLPILFGAPSWRSTAPAQGAAAGAYPPAHPDQFAHFAAASVKRYGPGGTFWRAHRGLPYDPILAWEVWNEPDLPIYWEPKPDAGAYARLLRATDEAIKRVDPRATVVAAGMPFQDQASETSFLSRMFRSGARGHFDALGLHPYSASPTLAIGKLQVARRLMDRFGASRKPIWVTEVSWAGGGRNAYIANQRGQAANLVQFVDQVHEDTALNVARIFWYGWQDKVTGPDPSYWGYHLGLFTTHLHPKLALRRFASLARRLNG